MKTIKKFTYIGLIIGSYVGWLWPNWFSFFPNTFFVKFSLSIIFGIIGVILGYKLYKYLSRKF